MKARKDDRVEVRLFGEISQELGLKSPNAYIFTSDDGSMLSITEFDIVKVMPCKRTLEEVMGALRCGKGIRRKSFNPDIVLRGYGSESRYLIDAESLMADDWEVVD